MKREQFERLQQRMLYLRLRIEAKTKLGWETLYDQSEHDALEAALTILEKAIV